MGHTCSSEFSSSGTLVRSHLKEASLKNCLYSAKKRISVSKTPPFQLYFQLGVEKEVMWSKVRAVGELRMTWMPFWARWFAISVPQYVDAHCFDTTFIFSWCAVVTFSVCAPAQAASVLSCGWLHPPTCVFLHIMHVDHAILVKKCDCLMCFL